MAWFDRIADDPQAMLDEIAEWSGLSRAELHARREQIYREFGTTVPHLTLNEIDEFRNGARNLSSASIAHHDDCEYCQSLVDATSPTTIEQNKVRAIATLVSAGVFDWREGEPLAAVPALLEANPHAAPLGALVGHVLGRRMVAVVSVCIVFVAAGIFAALNLSRMGSPVMSTDAEELLQFSAPTQNFHASLEDMDPNLRQQLFEAVTSYMGDDYLLAPSQHYLPNVSGTANTWKVVSATNNTSGFRSLYLQELPPSNDPFRRSAGVEVLDAADDLDLSVGQIVNVIEPLGPQEVVEPYSDDL